ncbi:hypothetical protein M758_10G101800 [Ceratodon purpureus]|nr:hypothetical protein M758_10G101800 [Ceratodon purpureus]
MEQRRIGHAHQTPPPPPSSSLLGIGEELYELLQGSTRSTQSSNSTAKCITNPSPASPLFFDHIPKMEPELGDFMGSSYTWGAPATQLYNVASVDSLACLTNYTTPNATHLTPLPDVTSQFAYTPAPAPGAAGTASPQIQALRDFMVYGNLAAGPGTMGSMPAMPSPTMTSFSSAVSSRSTTPVAANGGMGFYQLDDVGVADAGMLAGAPKAQDMSLAYRALCSEIYATERSPHRSQFQRENHILAERQRREEMNEKFSALRAMIPKATKKDKASIVGDTIDYVLELEKRLKQLQACKDTASGTGFFKSLKRKSPYGSRGGGEDGALESPKPGGSSSETTHQRDPGSPSPIRESRDSAVSSPSDQITEESKLQPGKTKGGVAEVDVQMLGKQAVVKVVCSRQPGHVLRVLNALEECKVEVLQSNVMTVADNSIHFITVQLEEGLSISSEELVSAVLQAINSEQ